MRSLLRLLGRPKAPAVLEASALAAHRPVSGLVVLETTVRSKAPATLRGFLGGSDQPFLEKALPGSAEDQTPWFAIHGHLLPNGPAKLRLELWGEGGALLGRCALTLHVRNEGELAGKVAESLRASGVPLALDGVCDSRFYDYDDPALTAWFDRPPDAAEAHIAALEARGEVTPEEAAALRSFVRDGYLTLENAIAPDHLRRLNAALDDAVARKVEGYEWGASQRIHNLHEQYPAIRELWLHPTVLRMLGLIFEEPARPCQSLTYVFGSEQQYHQDTIHLTPFPAGRMCGVWSALEDVQPDSGELVVFPGSHRERRVYMRQAGVAKVAGDWTEFGDKVAPLWKQMLERGGYRREVYRPKAGSILIWHENLMHAGSPRKDRSKSRRSIVGHYFARGAIVYYDSSGMPGVVYEGARA